MAQLAGHPEQGSLRHAALPLVVVSQQATPPCRLAERIAELAVDGAQVLEALRAGHVKQQHPEVEALHVGGAHGHQSSDDLCAAAAARLPLPLVRVVGWDVGVQVSSGLFRAAVQCKPCGQHGATLLRAVQGSRLVTLGKVHLLAAWQVHSEAHDHVRLVVRLKRKQPPHGLRRADIPGVEVHGDLVPVSSVRHSLELHPSTVVALIDVLV